MPQDPVASLVEALSSGGTEVVDLTQPLNEQTPVIRLPEPFVNTPGLKVHQVSRYDERGPAWAWNWLEIGEHVGTHLDAPIHWISGRDGLDVSRIPPQHLVAPAVVIDKTAESEGDPDFLLTVEDIKSFESEHGPLPEGGWLLFRTGWDVRAHDEDLFLNALEAILAADGRFEVVGQARNGQEAVDLTRSLDPDAPKPLHWAARMGLPYITLAWSGWHGSSHVRNVVGHRVAGPRGSLCRWVGEHRRGNHRALGCQGRAAP